MDFNTDFARPQSIDRCAWYCRVSKPKEKLEHQREHVIRFCDEFSITIPDKYRFEDQEKRHKAAKRRDFQELLDTVKAGQLDWIIICSFDRWGIANVDEFFEFRRLLIKHDVQLWSVVDQMNLTGITEGDYFRVVAMAIGATRYVDQMAEKNVLKMIEMAKQGWAASGNMPYGTDLVCYPLNDLSRPMFRVVSVRYKPHLWRVIWYTPDSRVERDNNGIIIKSNLKVQNDETTERMPVRDKKATGYRIEPSILTDRIKAVNLAFELYNSGMGWANIGKTLWNLGHRHYDKPFQDHALETILCNPAYIGLPAWGKIGTGAYRVLLNGRPVRRKRKSTDTVYLRKDESQWIQPLQPLYPPLVPVATFEAARLRLADRQRTNPDFGKRRTRDRATHPLNGKLVCPDCKEPMVLGSYCPAIGTGKKKSRCFNCGTYRKYGRMKCYANTIGWDKIDRCVSGLLDKVKDRLDGLAGDTLPASLLSEEWVKKTELGRTVTTILAGWLAEQPAKNETIRAHRNGHVLGRMYSTLQSAPEKLNGLAALSLAFQKYNQNFAQQTDGLKDELAQIDRELGNIAEAIAGGIPSATVRDRLNARMGQLETRKADILPKLVPLTGKVDALLEQLASIRRIIDEGNRTLVGRLLDTFVERVIPHFEIQLQGRKRKRVAFLRSLEFVPRETAPAKHVLPEAMEISATHMGSALFHFLASLFTATVSQAPSR